MTARRARILKLVGTGPTASGLTYSSGFEPPRHATIMHMALDPVVLEAMRFACAQESDWLNVRVALQRAAREDPQRSYDAFICAFGFDLIERSNTDRRRDAGGAFAPAMVPWRFESKVRDVPDDDAEIWREAAARLEEPLALARLHDLLWERRTKPRPDEHARAACTAYIRLAEAAERRSFERMLSLSRALEISRSANARGLTNEAAARLASLTEDVIGDPNAGPGTAFGALRALVDLAADHSDVDRLLDAVTSRFGQEPRLFDGIAEMRARRISPEEQVALRREQVRRWHASATDAIEEPMLRVHRLEQALGHARTHGLNEEAKAILVELQSIRPADVATESIAVEAELPSGTLDSLIESVVDQADWRTSLREMVRLGVPGGSREEIERELREQRDEFVFLRVFTPVSMGTESAAAAFRGSDQESRARLEHAERRAFYTRMWSGILADALDAIAERHGRPEHGDLSAFFATDVIGRARAERMARALELYWDGEFDESAHVLAPRIEGAIRDLARLAGIPVIREPTGAEPGGARALGTLMIALRDGFPLPDWHDYLFNLLADPLGLNLRNVIAHGLEPGVGRGGAALLIHAACFLTLIHAGSSDPEGVRP